MLVERSRLLRRFGGAVLLQHLSWSSAQRTGIFTSFWVKTCCSARLTILPSLWTPSVPSRPRSIYTSVRPSASLKMSTPSLNRHHRYLETALHPTLCTLPSCLLLFFIASFYFTPLCCRQLLLSAAPKFSLRSQPSVPVRGEKFFFVFFLNPHIFSFILHFSPCTHAQLASPHPSPLCCFPLSLLLLFIPVSLSPSLSFFGLFSSSFLSLLSPSFSLA